MELVTETLSSRDVDPNFGWYLEVENPTSNLRTSMMSFC